MTAKLFSLAVLMVTPTALAVVLMKEPLHESATGGASQDRASLCGAGIFDSAGFWATYRDAKANFINECKTGDGGHPPALCEAGGNELFLNYNLDAGFAPRRDGAFCDSVRKILEAHLKWKQAQNIGSANIALHLRGRKGESEDTLCTTLDCSVAGKKKKKKLKIQAQTAKKSQAQKAKLQAQMRSSMRKLQSQLKKVSRLRHDLKQRKRWNDELEKQFKTHGKVLRQLEQENRSSKKSQFAQLQTLHGKMKSAMKDMEKFEQSLKARLNSSRRRRRRRRRRRMR